MRTTDHRPLTQQDADHLADELEDAGMRVRIYVTPAWISVLYVVMILAFLMLSFLTTFVALNWRAFGQLLQQL